MARTSEIQNLFEKTTPSALAKVAKSQEAQKTIQDNRHNVLVEPLAIGTKVMVKNDDKLVKKLDARYRGPYFVKAITKTQNYMLNDVLGVELERSVPLHKLKVVTLDEKEESPFEEIHKIISHKLVNKKLIYLVEWKKKKNKKKGDISWVKPEDFANMKFINDYQKTLNLDGQRVTRSKKLLLTNYLIVSMIFLFFIFPLVGAVDPEIHSNFDFDFCELKNNLNTVDVENICLKNQEKGLNSSILLNWLQKNFSAGLPSLKDFYFTYTNDTSEPFFHFQGVILSKSLNQVDGKAFQCKKVTYTRAWSVGFWGKEYKNDIVENEVLDKDTCWLMVNTNKCDKNIMSCVENFNCRYELFPPDRFSWFGDSTFTFSHCFVSPRIITESHESSHIFTSKCKVSDWFCLLKDSIIVWPKSVVQECPFKRVSIGFFDAIGSILMERTQKLGFQLKSIEHHCGYEFLYTTEGLYIASIYASNLINLEKFDTYVDTRGLLDLNLADEDFRAIDLIMDEKVTLLRECNLFRTQLNLFSLAENSFLRIKDFKKNELILYTLGSQIYKPRCLKISKIKLVRSDNCYKYIPIQFYLNSYWKNGF